MRLLLVSPSMERGGAERQVVALAVDQARRGHTVAVAAPDGPLAGPLRELGLDLHPIGDRGRSRPGAARTAIELAGAIRRFSPDVVHTHNPKMTGVAVMAALPRRAIAGGALVATHHGGRPEDDRSAARLLRRADRIACVSADLAQRMVARGCSAEAVEVVPNGTPLGPDDIARGAEDEDLVIAVGRLVPVKAVDRLVAAAPLILEAVPTARFLVVGDGPERPRLESVAAALGLGSAVSFTGAVSDAAELIGRSAVLVLTSTSEGLPLVVLEAMAAGVPVVAPVLGGTAEALAGGGGVLVADVEPATVAAAVMDLLSSPERRREMGRAGRRTVAESYDLALMLDRYDRLYERALDGARRR